MQAESALQLLVKNTLGFLGYTVIETGKARRKVQCPRCKTMHYPTGWQGNTIGCPDLYVHCQHWKMPIAIGIELKTTKGAVRKEQKALADQNMVIICRSVTEVVKTLLKYEQLFGEPTHCERLERYLERNEQVESQLQSCIEQDTPGNLLHPNVKPRRRFSR